MQELQQRERNETLIMTSYQNNSKSLDQLWIGEKGIVESIHPKLAVRDRLMEMGLIVNTLVEVIRFAPFGDPIEIFLRGYHLSIRKEEAKYIQIRTPQVNNDRNQ